MIRTETQQKRHTKSNTAGREVTPCEHHRHDEQRDVAEDAEAAVDENNAARRGERNASGLDGAPVPEYPVE